MQMLGCKIIAIQYTMIRAFKSKFFFLLCSNVSGTSRASESLDNTLTLTATCAGCVPVP